MQTATTLICDSVRWARLLYTLAKDFDPKLRARADMAEQAHTYVTQLQRSLERADDLVVDVGLGQYIGHYSEPPPKMANVTEPSWHGLGLAVARAVLRNAYFATAAADTGNRAEVVDGMLGVGQQKTDLIRKNWPAVENFLADATPDLDCDRLIMMIKHEGTRAARSTTPPASGKPKEDEAGKRAADDGKSSLVKKASAEMADRLMHLSGDDTAVQVLSVSRDATKTVNERLYALVKIDQRLEGYNSPKLAELLDVTSAAVRRTYFWKDRKQRREDR
jgi:hypothetical protein